MKIRYITLLTMLFIATSLWAQKEEGVKWYSIGELEKLLAENPKPVFIDAYTDWCGWCKRLDADTFSNPFIAKYLNENFYPVKFDAESKEPITFLGKEYINDGKTGKAHQLAVALMQGRMSYPTVIFLSEKGELLAPVPGYRAAKEFEPLIVFFAEKRYLTEKFEDFTASFKGSF